MNLDNLQMLKLRRVELDMFKAFLSVCKTLNLRYYLIGGALLGAVRHKGFIPWDDDIDIGMLREDYEIFKKNAQKFLPEYYFVQTNETEHAYPLFFLKMRDSRTTFIETSVKNFSINHGVYIDIFPLDYYPKNKLSQFYLKIRKKVIYFRISREFTFPTECQLSKVHGIIFNFLGTVAKIFYPTICSAQNARERLFRKIKRSGYVMNYSSAWGDKESGPVEWFSEGAELEFEGLKVIGPKEYDKWLTKVYGEYMKLPPPEKRVTHHYTEVIDLDHPYTLYTERKQK